MEASEFLPECQRALNEFCRFLRPVQADGVIFAEYLTLADEGQTVRLHSARSLLAFRGVKYTYRFPNALQRLIEFAFRAASQSHDHQGRAGLRWPVRCFRNVDRTPSSPYGFVKLVGLHIQICHVDETDDHLPRILSIRGCVERSHAEVLV